jgi:hypothetical protein
MTEERVIEYHVSAFRGKVEDVPIADGVDMEEIRRSDPDPMFVTLPIAEIGAISNNGLLYDEALVDSIVEQINSKRVGGIMGHLKEEDRGTSFPLPAGLWVGAKRVGQTAWAKSYIPSTSAARDYFRSLKAVGGEIATSIYGKGKFEKVREGVRRLANLKLESLDFAPPARAALGMGAIPHVTVEMDLDTEQEPIMADKAQVIAELTVADIPAALRDAIVAEASKQDETQTTIAELTNTVAAKDVVIAEQNQVIEEMRRERVTVAIETQVAELTNWPTADEEGKAKLAKLRELLKSQIVTRLGADGAADRVAEIAQAAWEDIKPIAEMVRDALAGPAAVVNGKPRNDGGIPKLEDTPENRQRAIAEMGISI